VVYCSECGRSNADQSAFCVGCGTPLARTTEHVGRAASSETAAEWYFSTNGDRKGPVAESQIPRLVANGDINAHSQVWNPRMTHWAPVLSTSLRKFVHSADAPPPLEGTAVDNTWVWVLAFAPIIGYLLEVMVADATDISQDYLFLITIALNVGLSTFDERRLEAAGYTTHTMGFAWIVPVYLFKRASQLRQSHAYFWVWCVCFVLVLLG